ncbi:MAG: hypothetical protein CMJ62_04690 [Planctomycetaceae bacterium]|nr:hypothetical protein [Planctomycetaceae bacterium]
MMVSFSPKSPRAMSPVDLCEMADGEAARHSGQMAAMVQLAGMHQSFERRSAVVAIGPIKDR